MLKEKLAALFGIRKAPKVNRIVRLPDARLCKILQSRGEIDASVRFLKDNGYILHPCEPKNWDLAHILPEIGDEGNFLDMGSWESQVLANLSRLDEFRGELVGIDLQPPNARLPRVKTVEGDLMKTGLPAASFRYITCISVIEHGVNFERFAIEASRLLESAGRLFVTFDYWDPKIIPPGRLYSLEWQPLDRAAAEDLIGHCEKQGLQLVEPMHWQLGEAIIRDGYHSPEPTMSYTFGLTTFEKRS